MKTRFRKSYSSILSVVIVGIVITICTACGEKETEQKMMVSTIGTGYINGDWNNIIELLNDQISENLDAAKEQLDNVTEDDTEMFYEDFLADLWQESELPLEDIPGYRYFTNAGEGNYNLNLENEVAIAVKTYAVQNGMEDEEWELKRIIYNDGIYHAYVESATGNELYILLSDRGGMFLHNIIAVDIRNNNESEISLSFDEQSGPSYSSILEWNSYLELFENSFLGGEPEGTHKGSLEIVHSIDSGYWLYDHMYVVGVSFALHDYLDRMGRMDRDSTWTIDTNSVYVGRFLDVYCTNGEERISLLIDIMNKRYTVLKCG